MHTRTHRTRKYPPDLECVSCTAALLSSHIIKASLGVIMEMMQRIRWSDRLCQGLRSYQGWIIIKRIPAVPLCTQNREKKSHHRPRSRTFLVKFFSRLHQILKKGKNGLNLCTLCLPVTLPAASRCRGSPATQSFFFFFFASAVCHKNRRGSA